MRHTPISLILSAAALLGCSLASAQTLTIDSINTSLLNTVGNASVTIDPASGNVVVRSASGSACSASPAPTATVTGPSGGQVNAPVTVNWSSTNTSGGTPCTPSSSPANSSWNSMGASASSGSRQVTLPATAGNQALTMTCTGTTAPAAVSTLNISVSGGAPTPGCEGTPTDGLIISGFPAVWDDLHPGSVFPSPFGNAKGVAVPVGQSAAIAFTTGSGNVNPNGSIETAEQSGQAGGPVRISLSRCPGDFRTSLRVGQRCAVPGASNQGSLIFTVSSVVGDSICTLTAQTQYFLNVTHRIAAIPFNQPDGPLAARDCEAPSCSSLITTRQLASREAAALGLPEPAKDN